jgi:hypothetical protein
MPEYDDAIVDAIVDAIADTIAQALGRVRPQQWLTR